MARPSLFAPTARLLAAGAACLALAACTGQKPGAPARSGAQAVNLAGVGFQNDQFFRLAEMGMKAAADKAGVRISLANSGGSLDREVSLVDTYIAEGKSAIVIAPYNQKASIAGLKRAQDAGIKVITFDSAVEADFPVSVIKSDQVSLGSTTGEEAARYIAERMGGKANVAVVTYLSLMPIAAAERNRGFEDAVKKLPGVKIVAKQDAWMAEKAVTVVESILTAHPEVDLIWAANEGGTVGAASAVKNAGLAGKVVVFGTDMSEQMAGLLLSPDNILQAVTGQKPHDIGQKAVETAIAAVRGEPVEKSVLLPGMLFTRTNADEVTRYRDYLKSLAK